jgi:uncharacterized protein YraI
MRTLLVLTLLLGSLATGCQNSEVTQTPPTGNAFPATNSTETSAPTTAQTPQSSSKSEAKSSTQSSKPVATLPNSTASAQRTCQISAYVIDKDPKGLNVRSGPSNSYGVIGKLPTNSVGVIVDIAASQGDWVQLTKAESPEKTEFEGTGWVYTQLLGTSTRGYGSRGVSVYPSANTQSAAIGRIPSETGVKLLGCDRSWALVEHQELKGWIAPDAQCANPLTTCP